MKHEHDYIALHYFYIEQRTVQVQWSEAGVSQCLGCGGQSLKMRGMQEWKQECIAE